MKKASKSSSPQKKRESQNKCSICNSKDIFHKFAKNHYKIFKCKSCGIEFVYPLPDHRVLEGYYANTSYHTGERYSTDKMTRGGIQIWEKRLQNIQSLGYRKGHILDVGCATGLFLRTAKNIGWTIKGLEISKNATATAKNLLGKDKIKQVDLLQFNTNDAFDVITMWALLEHVTEPLKYIQKITALLKPNGLLAFSTPNLHSLSRYLLKNQWKYYNPPEHLFYFTPKLLKEILFNNGFNRVWMKTNFNYVSLFQKDSTLLLLYKKYFIFRMTVKIILLPLHILCNLLRLGDTLEVFAVKANESFS